MSFGGGPRYHDGTLHLAFGAGTNAGVDAFWRAGVDAGFASNGEPGERAIYHEGYQGAYLLDPNGNNIEAVCHKPGAHGELARGNSRLSVVDGMSQNSFAYDAKPSRLVWHPSPGGRGRR